MPKYNQPKGYRYKKGTMKREDGGRAPIFLGITVEGYWWCYTNKMWVKSICKDCPDPVDSILHASSDYGPIRSVKAARRHIRNHPEIEKGTKIRLVSLFVGLDVEFVK